MNNDLKIIKKKYGENMSNLCRRLFPIILEKDGVLSSLLLQHFDPNHELYEDLEKYDLIGNFKKYIYSLVDVEDGLKVKTNKTPAMLLDEAGYNLYECKTEKDVLSFKKYYAHNEELCTFYENRLGKWRIFFAVKKDVDKIKREDFPKPERQDLYGTSVISIQFEQDGTNLLSIKNRYNHRVNNPDATFSNNLDNIIEGLTSSFEREYGLVQMNRPHNFEIPGYFQARDGKYYKYNYEINNRYYCTDNVIIDDFEPIKFDKEKFLVIDYFVLDLVNKRLLLYDSSINDSLINTIVNIDRITIKNVEGGRKIDLAIKNGGKVRILIDKNNNIVKMFSEDIKELGNNFLCYNKGMNYVYLPKVKKIDNRVFMNNDCLEDINFPLVEEIGDDFFITNNSVKKINLPKVKKIGDWFFDNNNKLKSIDLPSVEVVGYSFLGNNSSVQEVNMPKLKSRGEFFFHRNEKYKDELTKEELGNSSINNEESIILEEGRQR